MNVIFEAQTFRCGKCNRAWQSREYAEECCSLIPPSQEVAKWTIRRKILIEYIEDFGKSYCANVSIDGELVKEIKENVSWRELNKSIADVLSEKYSLRHNNGYGKKDLEWTQSGRKKYATISLST